MHRQLSCLCVSDNHRHFDVLEGLLQEKGDIFIHGGDFTSYSDTRHFQRFFSFLQQLDFKHKIVIAGNHEVALDTQIGDDRIRKWIESGMDSSLRKELKEQLKRRCIYLEHQFVEIEGLRIFGSPFTPIYGGSAFQYLVEDDKEIWKRIPPNLDILVTHCPPKGILDTTTKGKSAGSSALLDRVLELRPKFHFFGHIHEAKGEMRNPYTTFVNVARNPFKFFF